MKKILSALICIAVLLSFAISVSAAGNFLVINDWSFSADDPNFGKSDEQAGNGLFYFNAPVKDTTLSFTKATTSDGAPGVAITNTGSAPTGDKDQSYNFGALGNPAFSDLTGFDTMRIRIDASNTTNEALYFTLSNMKFMSMGDSTVLYDMDHKAVDASPAPGWGLPVFPAGFNGYLVIDMTAMTPQGTETFDTMQSHFFHADA